MKSGQTYVHIMRAIIHFSKLLWLCQNVNYKEHMHKWKGVNTSAAE